MLKAWLILTAFFLAGLGVGVGGTLVGPRLVDQYVPEALRGRTERIEGEVARKQREPDRVLLKILTPSGAVLAIFTKKVAEIDLLVEPGDVVRFGAGRYAAFVEDPSIERVAPGGLGRPASSPSTSAPDGGPAATDRPAR